MELKLGTVKDQRLKVRSAFYRRDGKFYDFSYWGQIDHKGDYSVDCYSSPASISSCVRKYDDQDTGLVDKNGKTIYAQDILEFDETHKAFHNFTPYGSKSDVYYHDGSYCITILYDFHAIPLIQADCDQCVNIGNRHEDSNLLKK
jgi:hypothetical protein